MTNAGVASTDADSPMAAADMLKQSQDVPATTETVIYLIPEGGNSDPEPCTPAPLHWARSATSSCE